MGEPDGVLIVDATGFAKKGQDSVGGARQYCGSLASMGSVCLAPFISLCRVEIR